MPRTELPAHRTPVRLVAAGLWLLLSCLAAAADPIDDRAYELLAWVAAKTGYPTEHVKVTVLMVAPETINRIAYTVDRTDNPQPEAITAGETIFLPTWYRPGRNDDILVHELTHVLQYANDASFPCRAAREKQAYEVQAAFVDETGIGKRPNKFAMFMLQCTGYPVRATQSGPLASKSASED
jgi:hypothetical protein